MAQSVLIPDYLEYLVETTLTAFKQRHLCSTCRQPSCRSNDAYYYDIQGICDMYDAESDYSRLPLVG